MSTLHMPYDEPAYYLHSSRDPPEYDMASALDINPIPFGQLVADQYDGFAPVSSLLGTQSFGSGLLDAHYVDDGPLIPPQFAETHPHMRYPVPRRPISPELLFPPGLLVGTVESVSSQDISQYKNIVATPAVEAGSIQDVQVIVDW